MIDQASASFTGRFANRMKTTTGQRNRARYAKFDGIGVYSFLVAELRSPEIGFCSILTRFRSRAKHPDWGCAGLADVSGQQFGFALPDCFAICCKSLRNRCRLSIVRHEPAGLSRA